MQPTPHEGVTVQLNGFWIGLAIQAPAVDYYFRTIHCAFVNDCWSAALVTGRFARHSLCMLSDTLGAQLVLNVLAASSVGCLKTNVQ